MKKFIKSMNQNNVQSAFSKYKNPLMFSLIILPFGIIGGYFIGIYIYETSNEESQADIIEKVHSIGNFCLLTTAQSSIYSLICSFFGYILSEKVGLMKPIRFNQKAVIKTVIITTICGVIFSLDYFIFARFIPQLQELYKKGINFSNFISSLTYGGVIEEIIMRLFLMSLISFIFWKIFARRYSKEIIPNSIFIFSNFLCAFAFAALHLPATISMFGKLTPLIVFRCFLLNGLFGLVFGRLYRKYGIQYAIISHAGIHFVSKLIWIAAV